MVRRVRADREWQSMAIDRKEKVKLHFHREGMIIGKGASSTDILRWISR
jgi:hypothetical protein